MEARKKQGMAENAEEVKQQMFNGVWFPRRPGLQGHGGSKSRWSRLESKNKSVLVLKNLKVMGQS